MTDTAHIQARKVAALGYILAEYRTAARAQEAEAIGFGARFENNDGAKMVELSEKAATIAGYAAAAQADEMSWDEAVCRTFMISTPSWMDLDTPASREWRAKMAGYSRFPKLEPIATEVRAINFALFQR